MTQVVHTVAALEKLLTSHRDRREKIGFVPTMGALHEGHASLLQASAKENDYTVLSIFVNPTQFGPKEDFSKYPRTLDADVVIAEKNGVDYVFAPSAEEIYSKGFSTFVEPGAVASSLCGAIRPGHFRGVCTVVARLLGIVRPRTIYLGQKDIQQCLVLDRMIKDLAIPVALQICPTLREADGLAMSSRNRYLSAEEREKAAEIYRALRAGEEAWKQGERRAPTIEKIVKSSLEKNPAFTLQYAELRSYPDLEHLEVATGDSVLAVAALLGGTRLIDNFCLKF